MIRTCARAVHAIGRDERGTGLIELALIAPVLALLTVGIVDLSQGVSRRMELHDAVHRSLEKAAARRFDITDIAFMKTDAAKAANVPETSVTVEAWLECDGDRQDAGVTACPALSSLPEDCSVASPPVGTKCAPISARYVRVRIDTVYYPMFGNVVSPAEDGRVPLFAEGAMRVQ